MDDELGNAEVSYVFAIRKEPLALAGAIFFAIMAWRCWEAYLSITPTDEPKED